MIKPLYADIVIVDADKQHPSEYDTIKLRVWDMSKTYGNLSHYLNDMRPIFIVGRKTDKIVDFARRVSWSDSKIGDVRLDKDSFTFFDIGMKITTYYFYD